MTCGAWNLDTNTAWPRFEIRLETVVKRLVKVQQTLQRGSTSVVLCTSPHGLLMHSGVFLQHQWVVYRSLNAHGTQVCVHYYTIELLGVVSLLNTTLVLYFTYMWHCSHDKTYQGLPLLISGGVKVHTHILCMGGEHLTEANSNPVQYLILLSPFYSHNHWDGKPWCSWF